MIHDWQSTPRASQGAVLRGATKVARLLLARAGLYAGATMDPAPKTASTASTTAAAAARSGRHCLQIPGPTNVPDRILRAMDRPTIDHRGPEFVRLTAEIFDGLGPVFGTPGPVIIFPSSGTGAWEAAIVNTLKPGDRVLMAETGHFAMLWKKLAERLGLVVDFLPGDWRQGVDPDAVEAKLVEDRQGAIKAVMVAHNETSTGVTSRIPLIRRAIDRARHGALFMVDTISSIASIDYRHAEWGVDVTVACSQKGLMLPPGLGMKAVSDKALAVAKTCGMPRPGGSIRPFCEHATVTS